MWFIKSNTCSNIFSTTTNGIYAFVNEMDNKIKKNENQNKLECKCNFKNVICNFDFYDCNLCNGRISTTCPTPYPAPASPSTKPFEFNNLRVESREQLVLSDVSNDICDGMSFVYGGNNNENFHDIVFDYNELSRRTPATPRPRTVDFEGIDTVISGINILECKISVYLCESNIASEIFYGMIKGMWYYLLILFRRCSLPLSEVRPPEPLSMGVLTVCCFLKFLTGQSGGGAVESGLGEEQEAELFGMFFCFVDIILAQNFCFLQYSFNRYPKMRSRIWRIS